MTSIDTQLSHSTKNTHQPPSPLPSPQDYYMFLLRVEQGRDKSTRRDSTLTLTLPEKKFTTTPYTNFWEPTFISDLSAHESPYLIFQVIPIPLRNPSNPNPNPSTGRAIPDKIALGFDFKTKNLVGWIFDPEQSRHLSFEEIYSKPDIWKECRDKDSLVKCWSRRRKIISVEVGRFVDLIDFTLSRFKEFGAEMMRDGLLWFLGDFDEESALGNASGPSSATRQSQKRAFAKRGFHPSLDLVLVIQYAQFMADFADVIHNSGGICSNENGNSNIDIDIDTLIQKCEAIQEFLRDVLLKASVDVWMSSYEILKGGMGKTLEKQSPEAKAKIHGLIEDKRTERKRKDKGKGRAIEVQSGLRDEEGLNGGVEYPALQRDVQSGSTTVHSWNAELEEVSDGDQPNTPTSSDSGSESYSNWSMYSAVLFLFLIVLSFAWLLHLSLIPNSKKLSPPSVLQLPSCISSSDTQSELFIPDWMKPLLVFLVSSSHLFYTIMLADNDDYSFYSERFREISTRLSMTWNFWYMDALAGIAAIELYARGHGELAAEQVGLWFVMRSILFLCQWNDIDFKSLLQPRWNTLVNFILPNWIFDVPANWTTWYKRLQDCNVVLTVLYLYYKGHHHLVNYQFLVWVFMRFVIPRLMPRWENCKKWTSQFIIAYLRVYLTFTTLPYTIFVIWTIYLGQWTYAFIGLFFGLMVAWASAVIWKTAKRGYAGQALLTWTFVAWRIFRAGNYIQTVQADYFVLLVFGRWTSRIVGKDWYKLLFFWAGLILFWILRSSEMSGRMLPLKTTVIPLDIIVVFWLDWLSTVLDDAGTTREELRILSYPWY